MLSSWNKYSSSSHHYGKRASQIKRLLAMQPPKVEMAAEFAVIIEGTTERVAKIIQGLRSFCRQGEQDPFTPAKIDKIVREVLELCSKKIRNRNVELKVEIPENLTAILCRPGQISQILLNLIGNASDAVQNLEERWIQILAREHFDTIEISVTDSGRGISPENQEKLYQPFYTTKDIGKGTGLGLSIACGLVEGHKGKLVLDNENPHTRFVVILPKMTKAA